VAGDLERARPAAFSVLKWNHNRTISTNHAPATTIIAEAAANNATKKIAVRRTVKRPPPALLVPDVRGRYLEWVKGPLDPDRGREGLRGSLGEKIKAKMRAGYFP
jgi:hypothetical protein